MNNQHKISRKTKLLTNLTNIVFLISFFTIMGAIILLGISLIHSPENTEIFTTGIKASTMLTIIGVISNIVANKMLKKYGTTEYQGFLFN